MIRPRGKKRKRAEGRQSSFVVFKYGLGGNRLRQNFNFINLVCKITI